MQKEGKDNRYAASYSENSNTKERKAKQEGSNGSPKKSTVYQRKHWACKEAGRVNVQKTQETVRGAASSPLSTACVHVQKEGKDKTHVCVHNQDEDKFKGTSRSTRSQVTKKERCEEEGWKMDDLVGDFQGRKGVARVGRQEQRKETVRM